MKKFLFLFSFVLMNTFLIYAKDNNPFPAYSKSMSLGFDCSASCTFSSCSGVGNCSCSWSWFTCNCYSYNPKDRGPIASAIKENNIDVNTISINEKQYENLKKFDKFLASLNSEVTDKVRTSLVWTITAIKDRDNDKFNANRQEYLTKLSSLNSALKSKINKFFEENGATERI